MCPPDHHQQVLTKEANRACSVREPVDTELGLMGLIWGLVSTLVLVLVLVLVMVLVLLVLVLGGASGGGGGG